MLKMETYNVDNKTQIYDILLIYMVYLGLNLISLGMNVYY